jgi:hypothetical protein
MAFAVTTASTITCPHTGTVSPSSSAKLTVGGNPVVPSDQVTSWVIAGCTWPTDNKGDVTCASVTTASGGQSQKLTVGGVAVLLDSVSAQTSGLPGPFMLSVSAGQTKLEAV